MKAITPPIQPNASGGIQSLDTALRVLNTLAQSGRALPLTELARLCDLPATKVYRYLASFCHAGILVQNGPSGSYDLGKGAISLGLAAMNRADPINTAIDHLSDLVQETGLTAYLCVWSNFGPTLIRMEKSLSPLFLYLGLGTTLPLIMSATGRIYIANLPELITNQLLDQELEHLKQGSKNFDEFELSRTGVREFVAPVKDAGYAIVDLKFMPGLHTIAAPILDWQNHALATVTLITTDSNELLSGSKTINALTGFCAKYSIQAPSTPKQSVL